MENLVTEISEFFPELVGKISVSDLKSPTHQIVRNFFCIVLSVLGIDVENVRKAQLVQLGTEEVDIIPELNLVTAIRNVFPFLKFQLVDLLSPEVKRNAQLIAQVMEFLQFSDALIAKNNKKLTELQNAKEQEKELAIVKEKETANLNALACKLNSQQQARLELENMTSGLQNEMELLKTISEEKQQEFQNILEKCNGKQRKIDDVIRQIEEVTASCEEINKRIVRNPEEEKRNFDNARKEKERVIIRKREFHEKYEAHKGDLEILKKMNDSLKMKISPIIEELQVLRECSELKKSNEQTQERIQESQRKTEGLIKLLFEIDQRIHNENRMHNSKIDLLKKEETLLAEKLAARELDYKLKTKEMKISEKKYQQDLDEVENKIAIIESEYKGLLTNFNLFMQEFNKKMKQMSLN